MPRRVSSASSNLHAMGSSAVTSSGGSTTHSAVGGGSSNNSSSLRVGPRPAKSANCIAPASPSPDSSSDNASDNSDLFQWTTTGVERHLARSDSSNSAMSMTANSRLSQSGGVSGQTGATSSTASSRKRKLLEQFLLPENAANSSGNNTISLSDMRNMGLVGQARPSASIQPTNLAGVPATVVSSSAAATTSSRTLTTSSSSSTAPGGISFSAVSNYVPSFSFYQSRSFGPPSCSGGGSTESLCSSTADSACGHPPDLPDDGNLATPAPPIDVSFNHFILRMKFYPASIWCNIIRPWSKAAAIVVGLMRLLNSISKTFTKQHSLRRLFLTKWFTAIRVVIPLLYISKFNVYDLTRHNFFRSSLMVVLMALEIIIHDKFECLSWI